MSGLCSAGPTSTFLRLATLLGFSGFSIFGRWNVRRLTRLTKTPIELFLIEIIVVIQFKEQSILRASRSVGGRIHLIRLQIQEPRFAGPVSKNHHTKVLQSKYQELGIPD